MDKPRKINSIIIAVFMMIIVFAVQGNIVSAEENTATFKVNAGLYGYDDVKVSWAACEDAIEYDIYYKKTSATDYIYIGTTSDSAYKKAALDDGLEYKFKVDAKSEQDEVICSGEVTIATLKKIALNTKRTGFERLKLSWINIKGETGYQISKSTKRNSTNIVCTVESDTTSNKLFYPALNKTYYYKIRPYKVSDGNKIYGPWSNVKTFTLSKNYYPGITRLNKNGKFLDLRTEAGQKLYGYDIFQGSCTDGKYGYYILYNKSEEKCKIVKLRIKDKKVMKVSGVLNIHHGNDLTYNSKTETILAVHMSAKAKTIAMIDPVTLKVKKNKTVKIPSKLSGAKASELRSIKGFNAIAYDSAKDRYVLRIISSGDFLITDGNLKAVKYVSPSIRKQGKRIYAGLDVINGYIACMHAANYTGPRSEYNVIKLYTWSGKYKGCIYVSRKYEIESVFNHDGMAYGAYYHEYHKNGKLMRNNYIYRFKI